MNQYASGIGFPHDVIFDDARARRVLSQKWFFEGQKYAHKWRYGNALDVGFLRERSEFVIPQRVSGLAALNVEMCMAQHLSRSALTGPSC